MKKLIIVGTGETADIAYEYFSTDSDYSVVAFSINHEYMENDTHHNLPLVALETLESDFPPDKHEVFVALSSGKLNRDRTRLYNIVKTKGFNCATYVSSSAFVWRTAKIGENCFIFENNVLQHGAKIGNNVVLWSGNHIGHQAKIEDNVFVSSHCVISGYCTIGMNTFLGVNCAIADNVKVGSDCFVGMGSAITRNLADNTLIKAAKSEISKISAKKFCKIDE